MTGTWTGAVEHSRAVDRCWRLLADLVSTHPVAGAPGQRDALRLAEAALRAAGARAARVSRSRAALRLHPDHVDVAAFGAPFEDYWRRGPLESVVAEETFGDGGPTVLINAHLDVDVVSDPAGWARPGSWRTPYEVDGRMYGRGTSDALGGVASVVAALEIALPALRDAGHGRLLVQLVLDEEIGGNGTVSLLDGLGVPPDVAVVVEPSGGVVGTTTRGFEQLTVVLHGRPRHMVASSFEDNAVNGLPVLLDVLGGLDAELRGGTGHAVVLPGRVEAGEDASLPAARAVCEVTLALPAGVSSDDVQRRLEARLAERLSPWRPALSRSGIRIPAGGEVRGADAWAERFVASAARVGVRSRPGEFPSACDARLLSLRGIPTLVTGPGDLGRAHGTDEFVERAEVDRHARALAAFLVDTLTRRAPR